eukprot:GEMP01015669.1.p1 GENE.GEMP01015669.1~~GEMP01015669.1.p1  ORF type:complete len:458 (+),score=129.39 GEMP01015669.1:102-1475(+)
MWKNIRVGDWVTLTGESGKHLGKFKNSTAALVSDIDDTVSPALANVIFPVHLGLMFGMNMAKYKEMKVPLKHTKRYDEDVRAIEKKLMVALFPEEADDYHMFDTENAPVNATDTPADRKRVKKQERDVKKEEDEDEPAAKRVKVPAEIAKERELDEAMDWFWDLQQKRKKEEKKEELDVKEEVPMAEEVTVAEEEVPLAEEVTVAEEEVPLAEEVPVAAADPVDTQAQSDEPEAKEERDAHVRRSTVETEKPTTEKSKKSAKIGSAKVDNDVIPAATATTTEKTSTETVGSRTATTAGSKTATIPATDTAAASSNVALSSARKKAPPGVWNFFRLRNASRAKAEIIYEKCRCAGGMVDGGKARIMKVKSEDVRRRLEEKFVVESTREFYTELFATANRMTETFTAAVAEGHPECWAGMKSCLKSWIMGAANVSEKQLEELRLTEWIQTNGKLVFFRI